MTGDHGSRVRAGRVLDLDPELGAQLPREDWESAREACRAKSWFTFPRAHGGFPCAATADRPNVFALILTDGLLIRETALAQHRCLELLCPGDVVLPPPYSDGSLLATTSNSHLLGARPAHLDGPRPTVPTRRDSLARRCWLPCNNGSPTSKRDWPPRGSFSNYHAPSTGSLSRSGCSLNAADESHPTACCSR